MALQNSIMGQVSRDSDTDDSVSTSASGRHVEGEQGWGIKVLKFQRVNHVSGHITCQKRKFNAAG